jgi:hypothetical protein
LSADVGVGGTAGLESGATEPAAQVSSAAAEDLGDHESKHLQRYSIFDSALYRNPEAEWLFPQEKATSHDLQMSTSESKML